MEEPAAATAMEEEEPAAAERRRQLPWRGTVAVQAVLCLALYAAFSLGEPQLLPRAGGGVDAPGLAPPLPGVCGDAGMPHCGVDGEAGATARRLGVPPAVGESGGVARDSGLDGVVRAMVGIWQAGGLDECKRTC